jgi:hypothetical protein
MSDSSEKQQEVPAEKTETKEEEVKVRDDIKAFLKPEDPEKIIDILKSFKSKIPEEARKKADDSELLRFLRARKMDVDATLTMYLRYLKYRADYDVDNILTNRPDAEIELIQKMCPQRVHHGFTKSGSPIYLGHWGGMNCRELSKRITRKKFIVAHIWHMESHLRVNTLEGAKRVGKPVTELANIIDLKGLTWEIRKFLPYFKDISVIDEGDYPETMGLTFVVNAPSIFSYIWKVIRPWLDPFTANKVRIHSDVPTKDILELIDKDQLPEQYGGTCKCSGGCIPPINPDEKFEEYDAAIIKEYKSRIQMKEATIAPGKTFELPFPVEEAWFAKETNVAGVVDVEYFFQTIGKDIRFSVEFSPKDKPETKEVLVKLETYPSHEVPIFGSVSVEGPGVLLFTFCNYNSWISSKQLVYGIQKNYNGSTSFIP